MNAACVHALFRVQNERDGVARLTPTPPLTATASEVHVMAPKPNTYIAPVRQQPIIDPDRDTFAHISEPVARIMARLAKLPRVPE